MTFLFIYIQNMFTAGTDTSASTVDWAISELIRHPEIMIRAQEELDSVVGRNRPINELDLSQLPYLQVNREPPKFVLVKQRYTIINPVLVLNRRLSKRISGFIHQHHSRYHTSLQRAVRSTAIISRKDRLF